VVCGKEGLKEVGEEEIFIQYLGEWGDNLEM